MQKSRLQGCIISAIMMLGAVVHVSAASGKISNDDVGLNIIQTEPAVFPNGVKTQGITPGKSVWS